MNNQEISGLVDGLVIQNIFDTIQGEGPWMGMPCTFIRIAGCVLRCSWCDTFYSSGQSMSVSEVLAAVRRKRVVITGGEPLRCGELGALISQLIDQGCEVQIETSGAVFHPSIDLSSCTVVCSPKTSRIHSRLIPLVDHWKYVLLYDEIDPVDGLPNKLFRGENNIWVGPCWNENYDLNLRGAITSCMSFGYRLNVQLHKWIGVD